MESPTLRRQTTTVQPLKEKETNGNGLEYAYVVLKNRYDEPGEKGTSHL